MFLHSIKTLLHMVGPCLTYLTPAGDRAMHSTAAAIWPNKPSLDWGMA